MISIAICDDESKEIDRVRDLLTRYMHEHKQYEIKIYSFFAPLVVLVYNYGHEKLNSI